MIIYRPHRGNLATAMKEKQEFNNESEMKDYIVEQWDGYISKEDIVIQTETINDDRIGWRDTRYVCTKRMGDEIYSTPQCIGMCATDYKNQVEK